MASPQPPRSPELSNRQQFAAEVRTGLSAPRRSLSSKWFYDERGDRLFQAITQTPEYYLTGAEREIYRRLAPQLLPLLRGAPFDLIELGAGDGSKTRHLIDGFLGEGADFAYRPIDISAHALEVLGEMVHLRWPGLGFRPQQGEYFEALDRLGRDGRDRRRLVLFPGANIGNFAPAYATALLRRLREFLRPGDLLLTGFDLRKDPAVILAAYRDAAGHTAAFNLNLLGRINRELGADFDLSCWSHWQTYDPATGAARSYLVAREEQAVTVAALGETYRFAAHEAISVEISQKYSPAEVRRMSGEAGYDWVADYYDDRWYFLDSLWRVG